MRCWTRAYQQGDLNQCDSIIRVGGNLILPGSGVGTYTQNLDYFKTSGIEAAFAFGVGLGEYGDLNFSGNANWYLKWDQRSAKTIPVLDCLGVYSNSCDGCLRPSSSSVRPGTWGSSRRPTSGVTSAAWKRPMTSG